jgi:hypothetical protein
MKIILYIAGIIAISPFVLGFAVAARALRAKRTPELGTMGEPIEGIGYDDNDIGVDVDERRESE